jgi:hydroxypyruvate isomerase
MTFPSRQAERHEGAGDQPSRRAVLGGVLATAASPLLQSAPGRQFSTLPKAKSAPETRRGRIRQSVSRWCFASWPLPTLCEHARALGLVGVDLLEPADYAVPAQYGLHCTMGYAGGGEINRGLNQLANHDAIVAGLTTGIPLAAKANVPNVITFSGLRDGVSDDEGARNTIAGLKRIASVAEAHGVTVCMELLNSRRDHPHYMADHTAWGAAVIRAVGSPRVKLLYDAYHMQIMEGDLIETLRTYSDTIAHIHTGGVPGRHELDGPTQEVAWPGLMRALLEMQFTGYVAHEFVPAGDPLTGLANAVALCDV